MQDFSQLKKDYGKELADVIVNITCNIISGQVIGKQLNCYPNALVNDNNVQHCRSFGI
jgi:hypothetical protein